MTQKKLINIVVCIFFFTAAVWAISIELAVKTGARFYVAPDNITLTVDNNNYAINYESIIEFKPGKYHIKLSHQDFHSVEQDIVVEENIISKIYVALEPANDNGKRIIQSQQINERRRVIFGNISTKEPEENAKKHPFINQLPIVDKYFVITACYGQYNDQDFGICVALATDNQTIRDKAQKAMKDKGVNTSTSKVYYYLNSPPRD